MTRPLELLSSLELQRDRLPVEAYEDRMELNRRIRNLKARLMRRSIRITGPLAHT